jgi:drug/metabolite transporter (DMT)-like permease
LSKFTGAILVFITAICFSAKAIMIKLAFRYQIDPLSLLFLRMAFSLPFFVVIPLLLNKSKPVEKPTNKDFLKVILLGVLGYYTSSLLDFLGLQYVTAGLERLILFIYPTMVVVLSFFIFKKSIGKRELAALTLTYLGILLVFINDNLLSQKNVGWGALLIFASAFCYAVYLIGSGQLITRFGSVHFTAYAMITSCVSVMIHYLFAHTTSIFHHPLPVYGLALSIAIFSTVIPTFMMSKGIQLIGASQASIIASIGPVSTIILGFFILDEAVTSFEILGTILVLAGVLLVSTKK